MAILVTGGVGYIGSHTVVELLESGYDVVILDNLCNSEITMKDRIEEITGKTVKFYEADLLDEEKMEMIFAENDISAVIDFAALKAVGESVEEPLKYYCNNIGGLLVLLKMMKKYEVKKLIFSSSATVYGVAEKMPVTEEDKLSVTNPYGRTKLMAEEILRDICNADDSWSVAILRYFNPVGAHESGLIGEDCEGIPSNIMPYIMKVAAGELEEVTVFGDDYNTIDGTGVRDYIHVVDLAKGHIKALEVVEKDKGINTYNLGTGRGYSVLQLIEQFSEVVGKKVSYKILGRRAGDVAICYADPSKANKELDWKAVLNIEDMCRDTWKWKSMSMSKEF